MKHSAYRFYIQYALLCSRSRWLQSVVCASWLFSILSCCCMLRSFMCLAFVPLEQWWQVAFWPDKHPPLSQYSPELTLDHLCHTVCVCVFCGCCDSCLPWQSCDYIRWTQVLASQMKSFSYVCCLIDKQWQFSVGCQRCVHTHLMSPALAITSGTANDTPRHSFLRLRERSCNLISRDVG